MNVPSDTHWQILIWSATAAIVIATLDGAVEGFFWYAPLHFTFLVILGPAFGQIPGLILAHQKRSKGMRGLTQTVFLGAAYIISAGILLAYCYLLFTRQPQHEMTTMFAWVIAFYFAFWSYCIAVVVVFFAHACRGMLQKFNQRVISDNKSQL